MKKILLLLFVTILTNIYAQEPELVRHDYPGSGRFDKGNFKNLTVVGNLIFFSTNDGQIGTELYKSNGTEEGTTLVKDLRLGSNSSNPENFIKFKNQLFFTAHNGSTTVGREISLWKSDGTEEGTTIIKNVGVNGNRIVIGNTLYFESTATDSDKNNTLWKSDGTEEGTLFIKSTNAKSANFLANFAEFNGKLFFSALNNEYGKELWMSDGTPDGTKMVKDINPGNDFEGSEISQLTQVDDKLYFAATDGTHGQELWVTDGTEAGTKMIKDINPGLSGSSLKDFKNHNGVLFFKASNGTNGGELWKSDGTKEGTVMVKDIRTFGFWIDSNPSDFVSIGNILYFIANDGIHGSELWKSDGTEEGTVMVVDAYPGANGGVNNNTLVNFKNYIIYKGFSKENGQEPWISDGTEAGTKMLKDINPGKFFEGSLQIFKGRITDNNIFYFLEHDGVNGKEPSLWKLDLNTLSVTNHKDILMQVSIHPNPVSDIVNIKVNHQEISSIKVFNALGKQVMLPLITNNTINLSNLSKGIYFLQIKTNKTILTQSIIKN